MFEVKISYNIDTDFIEEKALARRNKMRKEFFDELVKDGLIEELKEEENSTTFKVSFGGSQEFLSKLPKLVWHFRVLDKKAQITLEAVPAV